MHCSANAHVRSRPHEPSSKKWARFARSLLPFRPRLRPKEGPRELPLEKVGCCSYTGVGWMGRTMFKAFRTGLGNMDLFALPDRDTSKV